MRSILFYLLCVLVGFFAGLLVAKVVDAGKGQMLAGGAIVLGYGVVGAGIGLVVAFLVSVIYKAKPALIVTTNKVLMITLLALWLFFYLQYRNRKALEDSKAAQESIGMIHKQTSEVDHRKS